jgi:DNA-binding CsgD family transcriptional regulator
MTYNLKMEDLSGIVKRRSTPGILIFDTNNRLLYSNETALEMIPELRKAEHTGDTKSQYILEEIYKLCNQVKSDADATDAIQKVSLNYKVLNTILVPPCSLRAFLTKGHGEDLSTSHILILLERITEKRTVDFEKVKTDFNLTKRELEVVTLICQGLSSKDISMKIFISEYTVKDHLKNIMRKMGVTSRTEIIASLQ